MSEADIRSLRHVELRLLRCTTPPATTSAANAVVSPPPSSRGGEHLHHLIETLVAAIERGSYVEALSTDAARLVFPFVDSWEFSNTADCAGRFYGEVERCADEFLHEGLQDAWLQCLDDGLGVEGENMVASWRAVLVMCIGVASLLAFVQRNVTGSVEEFCHFPLLFAQTRQNNTLCGGEWDVWARAQLGCHGSDVLGKYPLLQGSSQRCPACMWLASLCYWCPWLPHSTSETEIWRNGDGNTLQLSEISEKCSAVKDHVDSLPKVDHDDCDILITPRLLNNNEEAGTSGKSTVGKMQLTAVQQVNVLMHCLHVKKRNPDDELSRWDVAPFIEAIDVQSQTCFIVRCFCNILRARWESTRSRTKQRALLMMDKVVDCVCGQFPSAEQRICFSFGVLFPTIPALRKEYANLLVSNGMVGEALKTFEELELWDNLIYCYQLLDKKTAAVDLIKARLRDTPNDPRLWCSLGDVTNTDAHYEKALEVSNNRSARAKRSLAHSAYNRGDYAASKILWESAMALNSLYPDGWFALGAAALKDRDIDKAIDAFTRAVQLDPENGEAWNNIACLHMIKKKSKESFIAFKEALKFRRTSWQLWENYSHVAVDVENFAQALEAIKMVLDLTNNKRVDTGLLEKIMSMVEDRTSRSSLHIGEDSGVEPLSELGNHEVNERSRETEFLTNMLGDILQQVIRSACTDSVWGLYARWHKRKGNLTMCAEALLKQVRSYQGSDLWHDPERFRRFACASLQLCNVYMEISSSTGSRRELSTAEMHLRNSIKQGIEFADTDEFRDLQHCLDEIRNRLSMTDDSS